MAIDLGDGPRNDTKDVTMKNVNKLYNSSESLKMMIIYGCNVGSVDNGIGQALSNQLKIDVLASTTGQSFSSHPDRLTNPTGKHPDTGPTYMVPEGKGKWRYFVPQK